MATFGTFTAGQVLTAAELNGAGAWQDYTPSWTQSVTITKTVNWARYTQLNKLVTVSIKMTATSAGTANNKVLVGLPVAASSNNFLMGSMVFFDNSETNKYAYQFNIPALYEASTTVGFGSLSVIVSSPFNVIATDSRFGQNFTEGTTSRTGFTIASSDVMYVQLTYEAA